MFEAVDLLVVTLEADGKVGRAEAAGVYYLNDRPVAMREQIEAVRSTVEQGISRAALQTTLPAGGARNALDCALWDLEAKQAGRPAWELAGLAPPRPLLTTFTAGADAPEAMVTSLAAYPDARAIKLKLTGTAEDAERVRAVRAARSEAWLGVDANQGFNPASLDQLMPVLVDSEVALIEQPFPIGEEGGLDGFDSPISIAADESAQTLADLPRLAGRFQCVNIKLDKCGGLTEALAMARHARNLGLDVMVGNMLGTSLAMAPAFLVGQMCSVVDLDGPIFLKEDREPAAAYRDGYIDCKLCSWGVME